MSDVDMNAPGAKRCADGRSAAAAAPPRRANDSTARRLDGSTADRETPARMNRDEALRALHVAQKRLDHADYSGAVRFAKKSLALEATPEARALLSRAEQLLSSGASAAAPEARAAAPTATTSATESGPSSASTSTRARTKASTDTRGAASTQPAGEYTAAQLAVVKRVKSCRATAYYEILELEKSCSDGQVKKAYRKVSLAVQRCSGCNGRRVSASRGRKLTLTCSGRHRYGNHPPRSDNSTHSVSRRARVPVLLFTWPRRVTDMESTGLHPDKNLAPGAEEAFKSRRRNQF